MASVPFAKGTAADFQKTLSIWTLTVPNILNNIGLLLKRGDR